MTHRSLSVLAPAVAALIAVAVPLGAQTPLLPSRDLLAAGKDFDIRARIQTYDATASLVERDGRLTPQLAFGPGKNPYPGAFLPAPGGKWDLTGFNRVVFDVANTGSGAIRLGCRVSDGPVTDGHKHCNTEMVSLAPGEARSVTVIFGRSYGGAPGWKVDRAGIIGVGLHAEKPQAATTVALRGITALGGDTPGQVRLAPDATWQPIEHHLVPKKGSALDFAFLLDAPAGCHGPVVIRDGRMEYRDTPGQPARFYGANVVYGANFPDKPTAVIMADQLARNGYNSLRFHHFDQLILDRSAADSLTFDPAQLDRIDYFFACLKERGIYVSIDLYATRETRTNEIPELGRKAMMGTFKSAVYILDSARTNWEEYTRRLLTHVNPYTKLAWKDDPALFSLSLLNEGQVYQCWQDNADLFRRRFEEVNAPLAAAQTEDQKAAAWNWFLTGLQRQWIRQATAFVRSLGTDVLITDANYIPMRPLSVFRTDLDVIDIHCYWDGPQALAGWGAPLRCNHGNPVKDGGVHMPLYSVAGRLLGKPFMITEYNIGYPNRFRAVCGPMVGAYSAFQAIDAVYRFDHIGTPLSKPGPIVWFSSANDPVALLGDRLGAALFLRQEVKPCETVVPYLVTADYLNKPKALDWSHWYNDSYIALGMNHRIGTIVLQTNGTLSAPASILVSTESVPPERLGGATLVSMNDLATVGPLVKARTPAGSPAAPPQIHVDRGNGTMRIITERSECFFMPDKCARLDGEVVRVENAECHATLGVVSLDGQPLAASRRLLILHLTDVANTGDLYQDNTMKVLEKYGPGPALVRKGSVQVTLLGAWDGARVHALDLAGRRRGEVELRRSGEGCSFTAQTHGPQGTCMAYECVR